MTWLVSICFAIAAIGCAFFYPLFAWGILALPELFVCCMGFPALIRRYRDIPGLSNSAQAVFHRYAHYYHMPFAFNDFGSAAVYLEFSGIGLTVIGLFKSFWWGLAIGIPNTVLMGWLAWRLDPRPYIREPIHRAAHDEIMAHLFPDPKVQNEESKH